MAYTFRHETSDATFDRWKIRSVCVTIDGGAFTDFTAE